MLLADAQTIGLDGNVRDAIIGLDIARSQLAQFVCSSPPALLGEASENNKTAHGIQILRDQAMGQMGIPWGALQELYASVYEQAIRNGGTSAYEPVTIKEGNGTVTMAGIQTYGRAVHTFVSRTGSFALPAVKAAE